MRECCTQDGSCVSLNSFLEPLKAGVHFDHQASGSIVACGQNIQAAHRQHPFLHDSSGKQTFIDASKVCKRLSLSNRITSLNLPFIFRDFMIGNNVDILCRVAYLFGAIHLADMHMAHKIHKTRVMRVIYVEFIR